MEGQDLVRRQRELVQKHNVNVMENLHLRAEALCRLNQVKDEVAIEQKEVEVEAGALLRKVTAEAEKGRGMVMETKWREILPDRFQQNYLVRDHNNPREMLESCALRATEATGKISEAFENPQIRKVNSLRILAFRYDFLYFVVVDTVALSLCAIVYQNGLIFVLALIFMIALSAWGYSVSKNHRRQVEEPYHTLLECEAQARQWYETWLEAVEDRNNARLSAAQKHYSQIDGKVKQVLPRHRAQFEPLLDEFEALVDISTPHWDNYSTWQHWTPVTTMNSPALRLGELRSDIPPDMLD